MKDDNCIFCKLASGEIPSVTIYEDADFRVILDLSRVKRTCTDHTKRTLPQFI